MNATAHNSARSSWTWAFALDLVWVLVFATTGRASHAEALNLPGILLVAWPFAVGLVLAWVILTRGVRKMTAVSTGGWVLLITYVVGMTLRAFTVKTPDPAFLLIAGILLGLTLVGWRVVAHLVTRRRG